MMQLSSPHTNILIQTSVGSFTVKQMFVETSDRYAYQSPFQLQKLAQRIRKWLFHETGRGGGSGLVEPAVHAVIRDTAVSLSLRCCPWPWAQSDPLLVTKQLPQRRGCCSEHGVRPGDLLDRASGKRTGTPSLAPRAGKDHPLPCLFC